MTERERWEDQLRVANREIAQLEFLLERWKVTPKENREGWMKWQMEDDLKLAKASWYEAMNHLYPVRVPKCV